MRKNVTDKPVTLSGVVTAARWDKGEQVTSVTISATDEQEYLVENTSKGRELLELIHEQVQVVGVVKKNSEGKKIICVDRYTVIKEYESEPKNSIFTV